MEIRLPVSHRRSFGVGTVSHYVLEQPVAIVIQMTLVIVDGFHKRCIDSSIYQLCNFVL